MSDLKLKRKEQSEPFNDSDPDSVGPSSSKKSRVDTRNEGPSSASTSVSATATANTTTTVVQLQELLDLSNLTEASDITVRFDQLANALLHEFHIIVKNGSVETPLEILELEFYLRKEKCHEDPFTHGSEEQKISGRWYFHRAPKRFGGDDDNHDVNNLTSLTAYRSGSRKGLDLTIGSPYNAAPQPAESTSPTQLLRGGILLRTIRNTTNSKVVSGPSLLVDHILHLSGVSDVPDIVEFKWKNDTLAFAPPTFEEGGREVYLFLRPSSAASIKSKSTKSGSGSTTSANAGSASISSFFTKSNQSSSTNSSSTRSSSSTFYKSSRIGLDLSHWSLNNVPYSSLHTHPRVIYVSKPYRCFTNPDLLTANGRPQTFLGVLDRVLFNSAGGPVAKKKKNEAMKAGKMDMHALGEVCRITGIKEVAAKKYYSDYLGAVQQQQQEGAEKLKEYVGTKAKGVCASPASYIKMMGALERLRNDRNVV